MRHTITFVMAAWLSACGTSTTSVEGQTGGGETGGGETGVGGTSTCTASTPPPKNIPTQKVTFRLSFAGTAKAWVVSQGMYCDAFSIGALSGAPLKLTAPYSVECEGPAPPLPSIVQALPLGPGAAEITWSGTRLDPYTECVDCSAYGWTHMGEISVTRYGLAPVTPGDYEVTLAILDDVPADCWEGDDGALSCSGDSSWSPGGGDPAFGGGPVTLCDASRTVTASFTLPAAGDIEVPVVIPPK